MFRRSRRQLIVIVLVTAALLAVISSAIGCVQARTSGLGVVEQAWNAISLNYVDQSKLDDTTLSRGAVKGMVDALNDPYSAYFDPETYQLIQSSLEGNFEGIGAQITLNGDNRPMIVAPLENSPAGEAGLKTGDVILKVNGQSTEGMSLLEVVSSVRGPAGTPVSLTILHQGDTTPVEISVVRAQINTPSVSSEIMGNVAYIRISEFGENTNNELNDALQSLDLANAAGIALDLRSNPGGIVNTVVDVASHFIKDGVVTTLVDNKGNRTAYSVRPNGVFTDLPMVVLVDQYSASGSEVLTGALKDYHRATIAGTTTFGKGSYDATIPLEDGSYIYLTVGRWLTPNGQLIEGEGIVPDYTLTVNGDAEVQWAIDFLNNRTD